MSINQFFAMIIAMLVAAGAVFAVIVSDNSSADPPLADHIVNLDPEEPFFSVVTVPGDTCIFYLPESSTFRGLLVTWDEVGTTNISDMWHYSEAHHAVYGVSGFYQDRVHFKVWIMTEEPTMYEYMGFFGTIMVVFDYFDMNPVSGVDTEDRTTELTGVAGWIWFSYAADGFDSSGPVSDLPDWLTYDGSGGFFGLVRSSATVVIENTGSNGMTDTIIFNVVPLAVFDPWGELLDTEEPGDDSDDWVDIVMPYLGWIIFLIFIVMMALFWHIWQTGKHGHKKGGY